MHASHTRGHHASSRVRADGVRLCACACACGARISSPSFFIRDVHALNVNEGIRYRFRPIKMQNAFEVGVRGMNSFPPNLDVSKHHCDVACLNNYYFLKDAGSKRGTYIKLSSGGKNG